jgi:hypothetical protein
MYIARTAHLTTLVPSSDSKYYIVQPAEDLTYLVLAHTNTPLIKRHWHRWANRLSYSRIFRGHCIITHGKRRGEGPPVAICFGRVAPLNNLSWQSEHRRAGIERKSSPTGSLCRDKHTLPNERPLLTHLHLVHRLWMRGALPPFEYMSSLL